MKDPEDKVTTRERALVHGVLQGKSQAQAAVDAGYVSKSPGKMASEALQRPDVRAYARKCLESAGLTPEYGAQKLKEAIDTAMQYGLSKDGRPVTLGPDHRTRLQGLDQLWKIAGAYPDPKADINVNGQNVLVIDRSQSPLAALDPFTPTVESESGTMGSKGGTLDQ